jgi:type I restriction enzyme S subunit
VFAKIGEAIAQNYRLFTDREAVFDNNVMGAIPNRDRVLPRYLFRFLETVDLYSYASKTAVPALRKSDLEQIQVPLPDKSIQQRIAAILDKADAIRRKRQETIALTDELLRSTFLEMFGDPMMNPKGWPMMTIGEIASKSGQIVDGPFGSTLKPDCYVSDGVRVIRNFNIHDGCFDDSDFRHVTHEKFEEIRRSEARPGDLLISTKGTVGDVCRMPELRGESVLSATGTVRIRIESAEWDPDFIVHQMIVPSYKAYIQRRQAGSIQKYLNLSGIREFVLFKPPVELQRSFAEFAERNRQLHARLALHQRGSEELFDSLVQRAFRGEL